MGNVLEAWFGQARKLALLNLCIPSDGSSCSGGGLIKETVLANTHNSKSGGPLTSNCEPGLFGHE